MKKLLCLFLTAMMFLTLLVSCGKPAESTTESATATEPAATTPESTTEAATSTTAAPDITEPTDTLVARWSFDSIVESAGTKYVKDESGCGNDAIVSGNPEVVEIDGNKVLKCSALGDHLLVPDTLDFDFEKTDSFSVAMRFKWDGTYPDNWVCLLNMGLMTTGDTKNYNYVGFWINKSNGAATVGQSNEEASGCFNTALCTMDTEWHEIVLVQHGDTGTLEIFYDGMPLANTPAVSTVSEQPTFIAYNGNNGDQGQFCGYIDYIEIYSNAIVD